MKRTLPWLLGGVVLAVGFILYVSSSGRDKLNVTPDAQRQIEKAKRR